MVDVYTFFYTALVSLPFLPHVHVQASCKYYMYSYKYIYIDTYTDEDVGVDRCMYICT